MKSRLTRTFSLVRNIPIEKKFNRSQERTLIDTYINSKFAWKGAKEKLPQFRVIDLQSMVSKLMKRALKKINRQFNRPFKPYEINDLRVRYMHKVFRSLVVKEFYYSENKKMCLVKFLKDYMFLPLNRLKKIYDEEDARSIRFLFTRIVEINEIEEVKDYRKRRIQKVRSGKVTSKEYDEQNIWFLSSSLERTQLLEEFLDEYDRIKAVHRQVVQNKFNFYRKYHMKELIDTIKFSIKEMEEKVEELKKKKKNIGLNFIMEDSMRIIGFCLRVFKNARLEQELKSIEDVFIYSDIEC